MKKSSTVLALTLLVLPTVSHAQSLQILFSNIPKFILTVLVPFLFGIAFLMFVYNAIRYFVLEGHSEDGQAKAKALAIYSVAAFVFLIIFFGIVRLLTGSTGLDRYEKPCSDYQQMMGACTPPPEPPA